MAVGHYDVIIIGTGAGGGTLANRLAPSGKKSSAMLIKINLLLMDHLLYPSLYLTQWRNIVFLGCL